MRSSRGFTLIELLLVVGLLGVLTAMLVPVATKARHASWRAVSAHSLRQLGSCGINYLSDHDGEFWKYKETSHEGTTWWFGFESSISPNFGEGDRILDLTRGPLGPYAIATSGVKSDPAFMEFSSRHKPKFRNGNYGYGYNAHLGGGAMGRLVRPRLVSFHRPGEVVMFATCAQVNTFQPPADPKNPMIEEFYLLDSNNTTVHFRYNGKALAVMLDGSLRELPMHPGTLDNRMPSAQIGRFAPIGNATYMVDPAD
jgi:prepilin-type N-terminal cleavage/methylation domain-containing protein